jgi:hypothetical protein
MEPKKLVMRASLQGMLSKLFKFGVLLIIGMMIWQRLRRYQLSIFEAYDVGYLTALTRSMETDISIIEMALLAASYIAAIAVLILIIYLIYKIISLLFELTGVTVIDFENHTITEKKIFFPFRQINDENMFHQIIQVRVEQNLIDLFVKGGNLYMEYLVLSELDSQLRVLEIPYLSDPIRIKKRLASGNQRTENEKPEVINQKPSKLSMPEKQNLPS